MKKAIQICEVGPRDGLQSLGVQLPVADRVSFINQLFAAGLKKIEVGALVHPRYVPEMAESDLVFQTLGQHYNQNEIQNFSLLVPNQYGLDRALELGCRSVAFFTASSNSFNQKNINKSTADSIMVINKMLQEVKGEKVCRRLYISTVFHCPYEGMMQPIESMKPFVEILDQFDEVSIGDTTGMAEVNQVEELAGWFKGSPYAEKCWWHFHDTYQRAVANSRVVLEAGFHQFDSSAGGIGGCPFAPGAKGNISTESLVALAGQLGYGVDVDIEKVRQAAMPVLKAGAGA